MDVQPCATLRERLPNYAAGQLDATERAAIEVHLAACAECRAELAEWRELIGWLASEEAAFPPDTGAERGLVAIHARLRRTAASGAATSADTYSRNGFERHGPLTTRSIEAREPEAGAPPRTDAPRYRRIPTLVAVASVAVFLALIVSLFSLLAPGRNPGVGSGGPTPTATAAGPATPPPAAGSWHATANAPAPGHAAWFAPSAPQTGYLCDGLPKASGSRQADSTHWLYTSGDGGQTWRPVSGIQPPSFAEMSCEVFIDSGDARDVFVQLVCNPEGAADCAYLYRSRDGGATWRQLAKPRGTWGWAALAVTRNRLVALATDDASVATPTSANGIACSINPATTDPHQVNDLYASDDGGQTWRQIGQSLIAQGLSIIPGGVDGFGAGWDPAPEPSPVLVSAGTVVFVRTLCMTRKAGKWVFHQTYWRSSDGGENWTELDTPNGNMSLARGANDYYGALAAYNVFYSLAKPETIRYSSDTGLTWTALPPLGGAALAPSIKSSAANCSSTCYAQYSTPLVMALPDGSVIAVVSGVNESPTSGEVAGVYAIDPLASKPVWRRFASGMAGALPFMAPNGGSLGGMKDGLALWVVTNAATGPDTLSGPERIYLSPLP